MNRRTDGRDIEAHLRECARGERPPQELVFDPETGELQLSRREPSDLERDDDRVVIDQITEEGFFESDRQRAPESIETHMRKCARGERPPQELVFDPQTGELQLARREPSDLERDDDRVVIDQITEEGFFMTRSKSPKVVLWDRDFAKNAIDEWIPGGAFALDGVTVIHAYPGDPPRRPVGMPMRCAFRVVSNEQLLSDPSSLLDEATRASESRERPSLVVLTSLREGFSRAFLVQEGAHLECEVSVVPGREELFSRSRGLLETDVLEGRTVAIVGIGSGGSPIAVELAKAGVGHFVLVDPDRLELANIARHICGVSDLQRYKTFAVRDAIKEKNPHAEVTTYQIDVNEDLVLLEDIADDADLVICATDEARSRNNVNVAALATGTTALFGRAITRAAGGDVLRVRPHLGPCLGCIFTGGVLSQEDQEVTNEDQARSSLPAYAKEGDVQALIQPGLSTDIAPISNMMVRLALVELSRGTDSSILSLDKDLEADLYLWANRRERVYRGWEPMGYRGDRPSILRWYGARADRDPSCPICAELSTSDGAELDDSIWQDVAS